MPARLPEREGGDVVVVFGRRRDGAAASSAPDFLGVVDVDRTPALLPLEVLGLRVFRIGVLFAGGNMDAVRDPEVSRDDEDADAFSALS